MNSRVISYLGAIIGLCAGSFMLRGDIPLLSPPLGQLAALLILAVSAIALLQHFRHEQRRRADAESARHTLQSEAENAVGWKIVGGANDIAETREIEERFQAAVANVVDGFTIIDEHGVFEVFNPAAERIFGYAAPEVIGQSMRMLMTEPYRSKSDEYIAKFLTRGVGKIAGQGIEVRGQRKDGTNFPMELAVGQFTAGGRRLYTGVIRDLSERMRDEREQVVLHRMREQIWAMENSGDIDQILADLRDGLVAMGVPFDNCGINIIDAETDPPVFMPYSIDSTGQPLQEIDAIDAMDGFISAWRERRPYYRRDLAEADRYQEQTKLQNSFVEEIRSVIDVPFAHGTLAVNSHCPNAYSERDILSLQELAAVLEEAFNRNTDITTREQYYIDLEREVAVRQQAENDLKKALAAAEAANQAKSEFLANMSHEIRTPMNAVIGMTELTLDTQLDSHQREYLDIVKTSAYSLLQLIDDILDFSKIEAGQLDLEDTDFNLRHTVESTVKTLALRAHEKNLELTCQIDADVADSLVGDPLRLRQVLVNLLSNAIKFTDEGEIAVRVHCQDWHSEQTTLQFEVRDTGIGIPPDKRDHIFGSFTQIDASTTRRYGGTGLGLSICAQLTAMMGGRIWVESEEGQGSTFAFTAQFSLQADAAELVEFVPRDTLRNAIINAIEDPVAKQPKPAATRVFGASLHILIAEDNSFNQKVATGLLEKRGHTVTLAGNGQEALDLIENNSFDAVLMDVQMPIKDGLEATRQLRQREQGTGQRIRVIGLTAHAMEGDRQRCLEAGMDDYLAKPIKPQELNRVLAAVHSPSAPVLSDPAPGIPPPVFDRAAVLDRCGGDEALLSELVAIFRQDLPAYIKEIKTAIDQGDDAELARAAHTLKGSLGTLGFAAAQALTLDLETMGQASNMAKAGTRFGELDTELKKLDPLLSELTGNRPPATEAD